MKPWTYENAQWTQLPKHLRHLPVLTRHVDTGAWFLSLIWAAFLKGIGFKLYVGLNVVGDYKPLIKKYPKLLLISNHSSHLDATSITASIPFSFWRHLYISAAKDYWFKNPVFSFFSKNCLGAIPIDRKEKKHESIELILTLLKKMDRMWLILFPEGSRSPDGYIKNFKKGVSLFSKKTDTPILFLYLKGNRACWPKGKLIPKPGNMKIYIGPVHPPAEIETLSEAYKTWVLSIDPSAYPKED